MRKKSTKQSAFFNLRVLIGVFIVLAGVFLALAGFGTFSVQAQQKQQAQKYTTKSSWDPLVPPAFDCSKIHQLGIDKQENFRAQAIMIFCGYKDADADAAPRGGAVSQLAQKLLSPLVYGTTDVDLITGTETSPNITQSETFAAGNPDNPLQLGVAYNDSRGRNASPINISGASFSTDGGNTFTRLTCTVTSGNCQVGQGPFSNTVGDPVLLYHRPSGRWLTIWLDEACGGFGLGGYYSTTPTNPNPPSWTHFCVHSSTNDDRESGWVDQNPASPFHDRLYVSWNDFNVGGGALFVTYSDDGGTTWHAPISVSGGVFFRDVQITGDLDTGVVYIAAMDENAGNGCTSGCGTTRNNKIYRSTDGGNTWTNTYTGPSFVGPCRSNSGYFCTMYASPAYWRHMGWGQPAAKGGIVNYVYAAHGAGTDPGDVFAIRSTDMGMTFGAPFQLNSNTDATKGQWQPNLSVASDGSLLATWYDETPRVAASCQPSSPATPCYEMHARKSTDNGATWLADMTFSDVASPLPLQPDPGIQPTYVGDYDYGSSVLIQHLSAWADGRVIINGASQQDAFHDREPISVGLAVISQVPACGSIINTQPTDFVINVTDPVNPATLQGSDFTVNGTPADSVMYTAGTTTMTFHFNSTPVTTPGVQTSHIAAGAFNRASDGSPVLEFNCSFCYDTAQLMVTSTTPAVGGTFTPAAPGNYDYLVDLNLPVDPASVQDSDLTLTGNAGGSVVGHVLENGNTRIHFTVHFNFGGTAMANIASGAITAHTCNGNAAFSGNYTVEGCPPQDHYDIAQIGGTPVPGTTDTGNHGDDTTTTIALPFSYMLYGVTFNSITLDSNGKVHFPGGGSVFTNSCLPQAGATYSGYPYWDDLRTDNLGWAGCATYPNGLCGIFTSVSGSPPNQIFNIEWRAVYFANTAGQANFEMRLYQGQTRFDVVYGPVALGNSSATAGVQKDGTAFDQYFCNGSGGAATGGQSYILQACGTPTPSPTPTPTSTPTPTPSPTSTPTPTPTSTPTATPTPTPTPAPFVLTCSGRKIQGKHVADLSWSGSNAASIDVYRDGAVISTGPNDGSYKDFIGAHGHGSYTYKVCEAGSMTCSNDCTVSFGGGH